MKVKLFATVALAALIGLALPGSTPAADTSSIYDNLLLMKEHSVLLVAVTEVKEEKTLKTEGPYTLFAPTDAAFKKLDSATIKKIATDKETVKQLLRAHLAKGTLPVSELKKLDPAEVRTLQGTTLKVQDGKDGLRVGEAKLITKDIVCKNGIIHVIDVVLPVAK